MATVFPELAGARIDYAWGGNVAFTRDQMPHAGRLRRRVLRGRLLRARHRDGDVSRRADRAPDRGRADRRIRSFDDRFPAIPLYSGHPWFLPLVGAYYQVKDWLQ